jgi:hypothetical protein
MALLDITISKNGIERISALINDGSQAEFEAFVRAITPGVHAFGSYIRQVTNEKATGSNAPLRIIQQKVSRT